jgi:hypothetical protein
MIFVLLTQIFASTLMSFLRKISALPLWLVHSMLCLSATYFLISAYVVMYTSIKPVNVSTANIFFFLVAPTRGCLLLLFGA